MHYSCIEFLERVLKLLPTLSNVRREENFSIKFNGKKVLITHRSLVIPKGVGAGAKADADVNRMAVATAINFIVT